MAAGMCWSGAGVGAMVVGVGVPGLQPYGLHGCKVASIRTGKEYFCTCFVVVCYWVVRVFLYYWRVVPFRDAVGVCRWGVSVGVLVWLVVPVVVEVGRAIPPSSSV